MANKDYDEIVLKYQQMAKSRKESGDIDINDYLPSIYEMIKEDCVWDALESIQKDLSNTKDDKEAIASYIEDPPISKPGYYEDEQCFVLSARKFLVNEGDWDLGNITGDTWTFNIDDVSAGNESFTVNNKTYDTFKNYAIDNLKIQSSNFQVRSASLTASNICHYTACSFKDPEIITLDYGIAKDKGYTIMPHKINKNKAKNPDKWTITNYKSTDKIRLLKYNDSYFQIIEDMNAKDYMKDVDSKDGSQSFVIAASSKWGSETIKDGYKAQYRAREIISNSKIDDIIIIVDRNAAVGKKISKKNLYYNSFFFSPDLLGRLIDDVFNRDIMDFELSSEQL